MEIKTLDRQNIRLINSEINNAVQEVAKKYGVEIKTGSSSYTSNSATTKVVISTVGDDGVVMTREVEDFNNNKELFGITKNIGDTFSHRGVEFKIAGLMPRSRKFPVLGKRVSDGKEFKFMPVTVNT